MTKLFALATILLCSCAGADPDQFRERAAFEMQCASSKLQLTYLEDETWGVVGCGQRAVYQYTCNTKANKTCSWNKAN